MKVLSAVITLAFVAIISLTVVPFSEAAAPVLTAEQSAALSYMREEEKLAHDVYVVLGEKWGVQAFDNISRAETQHTSEVQALLQAYGLADPADGLAAGRFSDAKLQALYDSLTARGLQSLDEALRVGAEIEELDILDLQTYLAEGQPSDVEWVYGNLLRGSENHLRAFSSLVQRVSGQPYQPVHLSDAAYDTILDGGQDRGRGQGGGGRGRGRGRGGDSSVV